jgi:hypothetical protein
MANVAAELAVTQAALYKRVANLEALKRLVASGVPALADSARVGRRTGWAGGLPDGVRGVAVRGGEGASRAAAVPAAAHGGDRADAGKDRLAPGARGRVFGLPVDKARWLLATIAFYCIAGADTIYAIADDEEGQVITEFKQGMRALVIGSLEVSRLR